jgi:hypothetical protein
MVSQLLRPPRIEYRVAPPTCSRSIQSPRKECSNPPPTTAGGPASSNRCSVIASKEPTIGDPDKPRCVPRFHLRSATRNRSPESTPHALASVQKQPGFGGPASAKRVRVSVVCVPVVSIACVSVASASAVSIVCVSGVSRVFCCSLSVRVSAFNAGGDRKGSSTRGVAYKGAERNARDAEAGATAKPCALLKRQRSQTGRLPTGRGRSAATGRLHQSSEKGLHR